MRERRGTRCLDEEKFSKVLPERCRQWESLSERSQRRLDDADRDACRRRVQATSAQAATVTGTVTARTAMTGHVGRTGTRAPDSVVADSSSARVRQRSAVDCDARGHDAKKSLDTHAEQTTRSQRIGRRAHGDGARAVDGRGEGSQETRLRAMSWQWELQAGAVLRQWPLCDQRDPMREGRMPRGISLCPTRSALLREQEMRQAQRRRPMPIGVKTTTARGVVARAVITLSVTNCRSHASRERIHPR
jgi:hypothetical protein